MPRARPRAVPRKSSRYHHGDLPRAMVAAAVRTIQADGIDALTLRGVGDRLGVSRTALYRHFANKEALLAAVAAEGFRTLRQELLDAWNGGGRGAAGFDAMGLAYVGFAVRHPSHYRVMFGGRVRVAGDAPGAATDAFSPLVGAIVEQQDAGIVRREDPRRLALYIWSVVHGVAMLALDGFLADRPAVDAIARYAIERLRTGIASQA